MGIIAIRMGIIAIRECFDLPLLCLSFEFEFVAILSVLCALSLVSVCCAALPFSAPLLGYGPLA